MDYEEAYKISKRLRVFYTVRKILSVLGSVMILPVIYFGMSEIRKYVKGTFLLDIDDEIEDRRSLANTSFENIDYILIPILVLVGLLMIYVLGVNFIKYTNVSTDKLIGEWMQSKQKEYEEENKKG